MIDAEDLELLDIIQHMDGEMRKRVFIAFLGNPQEYQAMLSSTQSKSEREHLETIRTIIDGVRPQLEGRNGNE